MPALSQRAQFVATVSRLLDEDDKILLLLGDISVHAFRDAAARHPERVTNCGTCEQAMVSMGAGMALEGMLPIMHSIDSFIVRRAYEQIYLDFAEMKLPGIFITVGANRAYETMGPTHWDDGNAEMMRAVPGMKSYEPPDVFCVDKAIADSCRDRRLAYVRLRA